MRLLLSIALLVTVLPAVAEGAPKLTMSASHLTPGGTVVAHATGFTPRGAILSRLVRPDGTEYPEATFVADARGELLHPVSIILVEIGTYELQMMDEATKGVATTRFMVLAAPMAPVTKVERTPPSYVGVWLGNASRPAAKAAPVTVNVSLAGGETGSVVGTIAYPALACGGELWLLGARGDAVQLGERITFGEERCDGAGGVVSARLMPDGRLQFERRTSREPQGVAATGTLDRRQ